MAGDSIRDLAYDDFEVDSQLLLDAVNKRMEQSLVNDLNAINLRDLIQEVQAPIPSEVNENNGECSMIDNKVLYDAHDSDEESDHYGNTLGNLCEPRLNIVNVA